MAHPDYKHIGKPEDKAIEECAEVVKECADLIKAICKAKRFGFFDCNPQTPGVNNIKYIRNEIKDLRGALLEFEATLFDIEKRGEFFTGCGICGEEIRCDSSICKKCLNAEAETQGLKLEEGEGK